MPLSNATPTVVFKDADGNVLMAYGTSVPSDAATGYKTACLFLKTNGGNNATLYTNEGTTASADFNKVTVDSPVDWTTLTSSIAELNILTGVTATAAEINQAADESVNSEIVAATNVIAGAESGATFYLNAAGGFTSTLPAPVLGMRFRFIVKTAPTTSYIITTNAGANILYGMVEERAGGAGVAGAAQDTFNFVANQAIIGDWVEFRSDGTNWYYHGMVNVAAGNTVSVT